METQNNTFPYERIVGAYLRYQRKIQNISLISLSKSMNINKGFLSDLENGKRHFPEGVVQQFCDILKIEFNEDISSYKQSISYLLNVFNDYCYNISYENSNIKNLSFLTKNLLNSLGFFPILICHFYHCFFIEKNNTDASQIKIIIDRNIKCLSINELSIYYCFLGLYFKMHKDKTTSISYFNKSMEYCSKSSNVYTMDIFNLIDLYSSTNNSLIAYNYLYEAKFSLDQNDNYIRLFECNLLECNILTRLHMYEQSKEKLLKILSHSESNLKNNNYLNIFRHLAWNALLSENYDDCIKYTKLARDNENAFNGLCYFIPFSYYKKGDIENCLNALNDEYIQANSIYKPFLYAIRARIQHKDEMFEKHILKCYECAISIQEFDGIHFILDMMIEYYDEKGKDKKLIYAFKDMKQFQEHHLTRKNSFVLKHNG